MARNPRVLWANPFCMLDTSSGASMSVREMLQQLALRGVEVRVLGATIFDNPRGVARFKEHWASLEKGKGDVVNVIDGPLTHVLVKTASTRRQDLKASEADRFFSLYIHELHKFKPDLVWFYGGGSLDMLVPYEARVRDIPSAAYLCNGNYKSVMWCKDVDLIITDTMATSKMYESGFGFKPIPVGKFINPTQFVAEKMTRKHLLFINPSYEKGAAVVALLAILLEEKRPDIIFEIVESRGNWQHIVRDVRKSLGKSNDKDLKNVILTPNTDDMRTVYANAKMLLVPSLWYESGARVIAEALLNGIPTIVTNRGGNEELAGGAGFVLKLPQDCYEPPFRRVPKVEVIGPLVEKIEQVFDDQAYYDKLVRQAYERGNTLHNIETNTDRLIQAFTPLINKQAGDLDHPTIFAKHHKYGLSPETKKK